MIPITKSISKKSLLMALSALVLFGVVGTHSASAYFQEDQEQQGFNQFRGEVIDKENKTSLVFATLSLEETNISTVTNTEGQFLLKIPQNITNGNIVVSFLGYKSAVVALSDLKPERNKIALEVSVTELPEVSLEIPKDAANLVLETLKRKGENYFSDPTLMTAFYRETIKKRRKNVSLSEAVVNIYKTPYNSERKDVMQLYKSRKSTDYSKMDTLALKLQGGPFNTLFVDVMKYPEYIFSSETINDYLFSYDYSTRVNDRLIYVINFVQRPELIEPMYKGKLYIDVENKILTSAIYSLNITDSELAAKMFVRKKPANVKVWPTDVAYRVDYREKDGKWYYGYSNVLLEFKVNWANRLFNSVYSLTSEMAVTDWEKNLGDAPLRNRERLKSSIILSDEAIGFADPDFWGEYNIIEPEKSIESAIKKIQRQLQRSKNNSGQASLH
ncbi:carboxypeptidase-like regulatory domain-containing protein [Arenibacter sp. GZD96]|uniref:carboxypeptidase-like regulatory domain-containing protein n=1 Tax=Aurantibrevibacter litoralis TaxID=3106030 RepID=UPI002AFDD9A6|nr:carboxypeptidase-like regulatory domain-containing protein [Arenibacter sp. GZD-96]MEA1785003.1 carboxypeptidase-like regulatory domain-containing protein [Arenibacter sp. GZD-96]